MCFALYKVISTKPMSVTKDKTEVDSGSAHHPS